MKRLLLPLLFSVLASVCRANDTLATSAATLEIDGPSCEFSPQLFTPDWHWTRATGGLERDANGAFPFVLSVNGSEAVRGQAVFSRTAEGAVAAAYTFTPLRDTDLNALYVGTSLTAAAFAGGQWAGDDRTGALPADSKELTVLAGTFRRLALTAADGKSKLSLTFPEPTFVLVQDDRRWGPTFSVRIGYNGGTKTFKANEACVVRFELATSEPQQLTLDSPVTIQAGSDWVPLKEETDILPGSALDFSKLTSSGAPAGAYGRVVAKEGHFEFERKPGIAQRFYGANLCFGVNFLSPEQSARLAAQLSRIGYNAVRIHHYDGGLVEGSTDGTTLNPDKLARLDALIAACATNGLYVTTDLYVSRSVPWRSIGVERDGEIGMNDYKILVAVHEGAWKNFESFTRQLLTHVNPYTGRRYADEPALAWLSIVNEGNFGNYVDVMHKFPEWQKAWQEWLTAKQTQEPKLYADIPATIPENVYGTGRHVSAFVLFLQEKEVQMVTRMKALLRDELGCRALVTDRNAWTNHASDQVSREELFDYVDDHFYVDHPEFIERDWRLPSRCSNANPIKNEALGSQNVVFTRLLNKPFTLTEYNYAAPSRFRGVGGMLTGTQGALQDWAGIWRFAYGHNADTVLRPDGSALNYFDMVSDPLSLAAERATLCLFIRGDLAPLKRSYALAIPRGEALKMRDVLPHNRTDWSWLAWYARLGTLVSDAAAPEGPTWSGRFPEVYSLSSADVRKLLAPSPAGPMPPLGDGALTLDRNTGTLVIDTPRTSGGFTEKGVVEAGALAFDVGDTAATVWVSSLDGKPIRTSSHLLLTHLTDVQNSGIRYAQQSRKTLLAWGGMPHLVRNGKAEIGLAVKRAKDFNVYAIATSGRRIAAVPTRVVKDRLAFTASVDAQPETATLLYEIVKK